MVISIFSNYQQQQISVYAQQVVKILRRSDGGKSIKMSFKNVRYSAQKTVSNHLKSFQVAAPRLWNSLTDDIRSMQNLDVFTNEIKTLLFREAF